MKSTTNKATHTDELIKAHENEFDLLQEQGEERGRRLTRLEEDNILIKDAFGIKERENGERTRQIKEALARISEIGEKTEDEDKNIRELIQESNIKLARIEGFIQGQDKREAKEHRNDDRWYNQNINRIVIGLAILGIIIGFFQVQGGWHL